MREMNMAQILIQQTILTGWMKRFKCETMDDLRRYFRMQNWRWSEEKDGL